MCGSRALSVTLALPRRLEATPDGKWTCGEQLVKFSGPFSVFASSWTGLSQADKLMGRQCISLIIKSKNLLPKLMDCYNL